MNVKVIPDHNSRSHAGNDYVRVSTCTDPLDDTVTLATIERVVERACRRASTPPVRIKTLVMKQPMSQDEAMGLATCYAERKNIPVVCMNQPEPVSE